MNWIKPFLLSVCILFFSLSSFSQKKQSTEQYIEKYYKIAVQEMKDYKIPASITLAQGILESASGNSDLAKKAKNHFGIKCHSSWTGKRYYMDDDAKDECFRVYHNPKKSFEDHSLFLSKRGRYEFLFTDFATTNYKKWAHGLKKAGYATNPKYPKLLINLIEKYHLYKYDREDFVPEERVEEEFLVLEEIKEEDFVIEETNEYIKALMGRNVYYSDAKKGIFIFNRIKTIKDKGRTPLEIAIEFDINFELLLKYNEITSKEYFTKNQNVFLQPKRFRGSQKDYLVKPGDSMWEISQMFGIKLKSLYKKNLMDSGTQAKPGTVLNLKKKRKTKPYTISYLDVLKAKRTVKEDKPKKIIKKTVVKPKNKETDTYKYKSNPEETTININIYNNPNPEAKKVEETIENPNTQNTTIYTENKYVEKNEKMERLIDDIPVEKRENKLSHSETIFHKVKQGETLYFISRKYNVSIDSIKKLNNLLDNSINIGQELIISQKQ